MGLLGYIIAKGVATAARNSTIKTVGRTAIEVIDATVKKKRESPAVIKKGVLYVNMTRSSDDYLNEDAGEIVHELLNAGFENITLKPIKKLGKWSENRYGEIRGIAINGSREFLGIKGIPSTSQIIIEYLDFKEGIDEEIYNGVTRITPGKVRFVSAVPEIEQNSIDTEFVSPKRFCSYCGEQIQKEGARFCSACGKGL